MCVAMCIYVTLSSRVRGLAVGLRCWSMTNRWQVSVAHVPPSLPPRYRDAQLIIDVLTGEGVPTRSPAAARAAGACVAGRAGCQLLSWSSLGWYGKLVHTFAGLGQLLCGWNALDAGLRLALSGCARRPHGPTAAAGEQRYGKCAEDVRESAGLSL